MIVLLQMDSDAIIAPLTTSVDRVPVNYENEKCVIDIQNGLHCYCIPQGVSIGKNGFSFPKDTYIQAQGNLIKRKVSYLKEKYQVTGTVSLVDSLTEAEYSNILYCFYKSNLVPRGIRSAMESIIENIEKQQKESLF